VISANLVTSSLSCVSDSEPKSILIDFNSSKNEVTQETIHSLSVCRLRATNVNISTFWMSQPEGTKPVVAVTRMEKVYHQSATNHLRVE
jgi:hypothetical protein